MLLTVGFFSVVPASANNSGNTNYSFSFPIGTSTQYTSVRPKYDASSSYMKLTDISGTDSHPGYTASVVNQYGGNFSQEWYYSFNKNNLNQGVWMYNHAMEDNKGANYVYVKIKATRADQNGFYADGVWSPDSVGQP